MLLNLAVNARDAMPEGGLVTVTVDRVDVAPGEASTFVGPDALPGAYARLRFPGRRFAFTFVLMSRLIPTVAIAVPYYLIVQSLDLINSFWALILIYSVLTLPFTTLVLTLYFKSIPLEIDEAAQLEGKADLWHRRADIVRLALTLEAERRADLEAAVADEREAEALVGRLECEVLVAAGARNVDVRAQ